MVVLNMKNKAIKLSDFEYEMVKKARELIIEKGIDSLICTNCGWKPKNVDLSYGGTVNVGTQFLLHFIDNPECVEFLK